MHHLLKQLILEYSYGYENLDCITYLKRLISYEKE